METLADTIRHNKAEIQRVLQVGYAVWDDLLDRVEREEAAAKRRQETAQTCDFYDEQIWTFLVGCAYALAPSGPTQLAAQLIESQVVSPCSAIWFEVQPRSPRSKEGNTRVDLAVGGIRRRPGTESGIEYDPALASWVALCECKWYSDIDIKVSYDKHRNQLLRVIENALFFQGDGTRPERVHVAIITPASFKKRTIKSRLYQYKFEEYKSGQNRIVEELEVCCLEPSKSYPDLRRALSTLELHWVTYQDLLRSAPESAIRSPLDKFVTNSDGSDVHR